MISACCQSNRLVLGQLATDAKENEITAIPKLLELLDLHGAVVTTTRRSCSKRSAATGAWRTSCTGRWT